MRERDTLRGLLIVVLLMASSAFGQAANVVSGSFICLVDDSEDAFAIGQRAVEATGGTLGFVYKHALHGFSIQVPPGIVIANLVTQPGIVHVEPDLILHTCGEVPTGVDRIDAEGVNFPCNAAGIAIIDSGIDLDHPDLNVQRDEGVHCYLGGNGPPWKRTVYYGDDFDDDNGHGTHCAGIAAARGGIVGVAPGARLYAIKVLDASGSGYTSCIVAGIDWLAQEINDNGLDVTVANMSLGGQGESEAMYIAMDNCPVTFTVSAGNSKKDIFGPDGAFGGGDDFVPAAYGAVLGNVLTISALADSDGKPGGLGPDTSFGPDDSFASFSNYSADGGIAYILPGVDIKSTYMGGGYATMSGTSMAAPHAAGLLALQRAGGSFTTHEQDNPDYGLAYLYPEPDGDPDTEAESLGYSTYPGAPVGNTPPTADFTYEVTDLTVDFTDSSRDDDGTIVGWNWDFGDDASSTVPSPSHTYGNPGTYSVTLAVTDNEEATDSVTKTVTVSVAGSETIGVADIAFAPAGPHLKITITIADSSGNPVAEAMVNAELALDGDLLSKFSGTTDSAGQVGFTEKFTDSGTYVLTVVGVTHTDYDWDGVRLSQTYIK